MRSSTTRKDLDFYLNLHYPVTIHADPEGGFVAEIEELPGCMTQGETLEEVFEAIEDARHGWIQVAYENGRDIPLPRDMEEYSGKILVRIPRSLHRNLVRAAKREGVSLNQYVATLLAAGVQRDILAGQIKEKAQEFQLSQGQTEQKEGEMDPKGLARRIVQELPLVLGKGANVESKWLERSNYFSVYADGRVLVWLDICQGHVSVWKPTRSKKGNLSSKLIAKVESEGDIPVALEKIKELYLEKYRTMSK